MHSETSNITTVGFFNSSYDNPLLKYNLLKRAYAQKGCESAGSQVQLDIIIHETSSDYREYLAFTVITFTVQHLPKAFKITGNIQTPRKLSRKHHSLVNV